MGKKILVISQYYYPEPFKITQICEELVKKGNEVTVLTGLPNYNFEDIPDKYKNGKNRKEIINNVEVIRVFEVARKKGVLRLVLNYISFMIFSCWKVLKLNKNYDIVFVYQLSPVLMAVPGILYKKLYKKPLYLYCLDLWPESMNNILKNKNNLIYKLMKLISTKIYKSADKVAITSKPFFKYFEKEHNIDSNKISYIPQSGDDNYLNKDFKSIDNGVVDFVFMGNIGLIQDIECILNAVEEIKNLTNYKVHFVGAGAYLEKAKEIVKEKKIQDFIVFHGFHPVEKMKEFYRLADVCLLTLKGGTYVSQTMPGKLQGYMAAGKPVVASIDGAASETIKESSCGLCVKASDWKGLANLFKEIIEDPNKIKEMGENGREFYRKKFTSEKQVNSILKNINDLN
ncbi:MAG: glycosyltransferase family 4 protein [Sarcina sp.]|uniref:glycosyltransferase family 4 protein n=1 Tax=Cetobacterium sp. TaxID=2071632 RepID=UPI003F34B56A